MSNKRPVTYPAVRVPGGDRKIGGRLSDGRAFTLMELLLVVVILGILAAMIAPNLSGRSRQARIAAAKQEINGSLGIALDLYEQDIGRYPTTKQGLKALVKRPPGASNWNGPYIKSGNVPEDPWGRSYRYMYPPEDGRSLYALSSAGPDGKQGTDDDIHAHQ